MQTVFVEFNKDIRAFQEVLSILATIVEIWLGLICLAGIVGNCQAPVPQTSSGLIDIAISRGVPVEFQQPFALELSQELKVSDLRSIAKTQGVSATSRLNKSQLLAALNAINQREKHPR